MNHFNDEPDIYAKYDDAQREIVRLKEENERLWRLPGLVEGEESSLQKGQYAQSMQKEPDSPGEGGAGLEAAVSRISSLGGKDLVVPGPFCRQRRRIRQTVVQSEDEKERLSTGMRQRVGQAVLR